MIYAEFVCYGILEETPVKYNNMLKSKSTISKVDKHPKKCNIPWIFHVKRLEIHIKKKAVVGDDTVGNFHILTCLHKCLSQHIR